MRWMHSPGGQPCRIRVFSWFGRWIGVSLLAVMFAGCTAPFTGSGLVLRDADGDPILLEDITEITSDEDLDDEEKEEALRELGIEDEKLIELLIENF